MVSAAGAHYGGGPFLLGPINAPPKLGRGRAFRRNRLRLKRPDWRLSAVSDAYSCPVSVKAAVSTRVGILLTLIL